MSASDDKSPSVIIIFNGRRSAIFFNAMRNQKLIIILHETMATMVFLELKLQDMNIQWGWGSPQHK